MDDGYKSSNGFYLCTESYTLEENETLCFILKNKFSLECSIHKHTNGHRLYINKKSKDILLFLIKPYLISHFYYKFYPLFFFFFFEWRYSLNQYENIGNYLQQVNISSKVKSPSESDYIVL